MIHIQTQIRAGTMLTRRAFMLPIDPAPDRLRQPQRGDQRSVDLDLVEREADREGPQGDIGLDAGEHRRGTESMSSFFVPPA